MGSTVSPLPSGRIACVAGQSPVRPVRARSGDDKEFQPELGVRHDFG